MAALTMDEWAEREKTDWPAEFDALDAIRAAGPLPKVERPRADSEARRRAERLGYRLEQHQGDDKYLIRDLHTGVRVAHGLTFTAVLSWLARAERAGS